MSPVQVDVYMPLPEGWGICLSCEMLMARAHLDQGPQERGLDEYPPDWQEDFHRFSELIFNLSARYGDSVLIRIFDPRSLQGLARSIRYGVHRYPTFIVNGRQKVAGWDVSRVESELQSAGASLQPEAASLEQT